MRLPHDMTVEFELNFCSAMFNENNVKFDVISLPSMHGVKTENYDFLRYNNNISLDYELNQ